MDPVSLALLWLKWRPIKRWRELKEARRAATTDAAPAAGNDGMSEWQKSLLRSVPKMLGTAIAVWAIAHGHFAPSQSDQLIVDLESIGGGLLAIGGLWLSHRKHAGT